MIKLTTFCTVSAVTLLFTGCDSIATKEKTETETATAIALETPDVPDLWAEAADAGEVNNAWLGAFNDRTLTRLVEEAQANNKDLQASAAGVEQARALAIQAGAALKPTAGVSAGGSGSGNLEGNSNGSLQVGLQVSWELDLWGRIRAGKRSATAGFEAVLADYEFAQHSIAATTAKAYFAAIETNEQTRIIEETLSALLETERIVKVKYDEGLASAQDLALTRSDLATAREQLARIRGSQRNASRALELLLGRYPSAELTVKAKLPSPPKNPPAGLPSELLERRPDMVAAERRVASAFNSTAQAKAARLPSLSLTGSLGGSSDALSSILNPANLAWQAGTSLLAPILDGGTREAQVDIETAEQKQALAAYGQAALNAFAEVEQNLDQGVVLDERAKELATALTEANKAYKIASIRYEEGETDLLDQLTIQQRSIAAESSLVSVQRLLLEQRVNLNLALGGDWK